MRLSEAGSGSEDETSGANATAVAAGGRQKLFIVLEFRRGKVIEYQGVTGLGSIFPGAGDLSGHFVSSTPAKNFLMSFGRLRRLFQGAINTFVVLFVLKSTVL